MRLGARCCSADGCARGWLCIIGRVDLDEIKRLANEAHLRTLRDLALVGVLTAIAFWIASVLELNEHINRWTADLEFVQADELRTTLLVLAIGLGWFSWRRWRELRRELTLRVELEADLARSLEDNRDLTRRSLELQERERKDIAHELHDELGQYLNAIEIEAVGLRRQLESGSTDAEPVERSRGMARHVYEVARTLMYRLRPVGLDELGLEEALQSLVDGWQQQRPDVRYTLAIEPDLPPLGEGLNMTVFRLVQESLTNVARHSGARRVSVRLGAENASTLAIDVEDDGRGLPERIRPGLGLTGMRERAELLGGRMELGARQDASQRGTLLQFRLPMDDKEMHA
jgi:two-component system sensor histidine kinase UhpB